jgi:hypothetical protein
MPLLRMVWLTHARSSGWGDLERVFRGAMSAPSAGMEAETKQYSLGLDAVPRYGSCVCIECRPSFERTAELSG